MLSFLLIKKLKTSISKERNKRGFNLSNQLKDYCESFDQLSPSEKQNIQESLKEFTRHGDIMDAWLQIQDDSLRLYECLGLEDEKYQMHEVRNKKKCT
jgi:hypothetical protein